MIAGDLIGTWELQSYRLEAAGGRPVEYPLGIDAVGILIYTRDGHMSAQLMRRGRPDYDVAESTGGTGAQTEAAAHGYLAYAGPYDFDADSSTVHHHVTVSLLPNWLRHAQLRRADLDGDRLVLSAHSPRRDGSTATATLVWIRAALHDAA